jgi:hypothetical protein
MGKGYLVTFSNIKIGGIAGRTDEPDELLEVHAELAQVGELHEPVFEKAVVLLLKYDTR